METETLLPGQPRTRAEGEAYTAALAAFDEAQAALAATPTTELLRKAYQLTHVMDHSSAPRDLRQQRDMIDAEILRRTDHGHSLRTVR